MSWGWSGTTRYGLLNAGVSVGKACPDELYGLAKATGSEKLLAGEPGGVFRRQKDSDGGDVARLADAAERSLRDGALLEIRSDDAAAVGAFGLDHAGIDWC